MNQMRVICEECEWKDRTGEQTGTHQHELPCRSQIIVTLSPRVPDAITTSDHSLEYLAQIHCALFFSNF